LNSNFSNASETPGRSPGRWRSLVHVLLEHEHHGAGEAREIVPHCGLSKLACGSGEPVSPMPIQEVWKPDRKDYLESSAPFLKAGLEWSFACPGFGPDDASPLGTSGGGIGAVGVDGGD
jgi:hypothetical protein